MDFAPKAMLEILSRDIDVEALVDSLLRGAHTGRRGDGKVLVTDVESVVGIRSRQSGEQAT